MFKFFGVVASILVFVAVHALTDDNLIALLAALCFLALEHWQRKTKEFYRRAANAKPFVSRALPNVARQPWRKPQQGSQQQGQGADSYQQLLVACLGDKGKVERLIAYELRKNAALSRSDAIASALDRLLYDRGHHRS